MSHYVVDVEADGPYPGDYSIVCFGAVKVEPSLSNTFYGQTSPVSDEWRPESLAISGFSREQHLTFPVPTVAIIKFILWVESTTIGRPIFWSDNNGFDWMFMCYYMHKFAKRNPFGHSSRRIPDLYCGIQRNAYSKWKHLRVTQHTHHPVDDAKGNAEVLLKMKDMGLTIGFS